MRYEAQLEALAASIGPLRRALAAIAFQLLTTRAHERLGYARLADYARERPGISARQLQELARVHRALLGLPRLEGALLGNVLPWSKVRLVATVASAADEAGWIARAGRSTVRALEREVRAHGTRSTASSTETSTASSAESSTATESARESTVSVDLRCTPSVRSQWEEVRELAERVAGERLSQGDALEAVLAEASSALAIDGVESDAVEPDAVEHAASLEPSATEPAPPPGEDLAPRSAQCDAPWLAELTRGIAEADAFALDHRLLRAIRWEQSLDAVLAQLLRRVAAVEHEWEHAYQPVTEWARERLGLSATKTRALVRLDRAGSFIPKLREAHERGALSWAKAQCLLPLLMLDVDTCEGDWREGWVEWAERVTVRRLENDVRRVLQLRGLDSAAFSEGLDHPEHVASQPMCAHPEGSEDPEASEHLVWRVPREVALLYHGVTRTLRSRLARDAVRAVTEGDLFAGILHHALVTWTQAAPKARRPDPVIERDGYRCAVPGCTSRKNLHDHHIVFRSAGGGNEEANRITLCAFHHQRGVHAGTMRIAGRAPDHLSFELGLRETGPPLVRYRSGDVRAA